MRFRSGKDSKLDSNIAKNALKEADRLNNGSAAQHHPSLITIVTNALEDAKAEDITSINLAGKTSIGDYMVVASGRSQRHVGAVADQLIEKLKAQGVRNIRVEGMQLCDWVLLDTGDIIVHIFRPEVRAFYNLEKMWTSERPSVASSS